MSYGDSSINFELRAWTEQTNSVQVHSDLTVAIYNAIYAAGMSFPFPQREVRVIGNSQSESLVALTDGGNKAKAEAAVSVQTESSQTKKERQ
jgi:small-conductance mechanosensitive channel